MITASGRWPVLDNQPGKGAFLCRWQNQTPLTRRTAPFCQMLRRQAVPARNRAHLHTGLKTFGNDLRLDLIRPGPPARWTFQDLKPAYMAPSRSQQMLHRLFQSFAPNQNAKLAQTTLTENPLCRWGARNAYETPLPDTRPPGLSRAFAEQPAKAAQWRAFSTSPTLDGKPLTETIDDIWTIIEPALRAART